MPAFRDTLSPQQIADLTRYLRARFAPDKPAWSDPARAIKP
jgi:nicotinate dehydrogenase subunit B